MLHVACAARSPVAFRGAAAGWRAKWRVASLQLKKARESWPLWGALLTNISDDTTELDRSFQHRRHQLRDLAASAQGKQVSGSLGGQLAAAAAAVGTESVKASERTSAEAKADEQNEFTVHVQKWPVYAGSPRWAVPCLPSTTLAQLRENIAAVAKLPIGQICLLKGDVKFGKDSMTSAMQDLGLVEGTSLVLKLGSF